MLFESGSELDAHGIEGWGNTEKDAAEESKSDGEEEDGKIE